VVGRTCPVLTDTVDLTSHYPSTCVEDHQLFFPRGPCSLLLAHTHIHYRSFVVDPFGICILVSVVGEGLNSGIVRFGRLAALPGFVQVEVRAVGRFEVEIEDEVVAVAVAVAGGVPRRHIECMEEVPQTLL